MEQTKHFSAELPQHIIHHILSLVPGGISTTELTRLGLVSKGWLQACCSYEIIDLCQTCSYNGVKSIKESKGFFRFADKVMTRYRDTPIQKLRLQLDFQVAHYARNYVDDNVIASALLVDKWINIALDNHVQDLDLRLKVSSQHQHDWEYPIPTRVMSSGFIKSLSLGHQVCLPLPSSIDMFSLVSLQSLEIFQVVAINNDAVFQRLIKACPAVEKLVIDSEYLDEINVSGLHHLKMISISRYTDVVRVFPYGWTRTATIKTFKVKIEAPSLETLWLSGFVPRVSEHNRYVKYYYKASVHVDLCNLKHLKLTRVVGINDDDEQYHGFLLSFPKLESLELQDCSLTNLILDDNTMLKKVELKVSHHYDGNLDHIHISCHKDTHFLCETISPKKFPVILVENNCPRYVQIVLKASEMHIFPYGFRKIRETMASINSVNIHTSLSCNFTWKRERCEANEMAPTHNLPASKIDNLTLAIAAPYQSYPVILSRFFSTVHPTTLQVSLADDKNGKDHEFLKFVCESFANRGNSQKSCRACSSHIKCWKHHQLKEAKIECIKGPTENIYLDWDMMLKRLPTLTVGHSICFRLEWVE